MKLAQIRARISEIEDSIEGSSFLEFASFERDGRTLHVAITARFRRLARKAKMWKSRGMHTALKNAQYGFREDQARSRGGADGIFLLDRTFRPENEMMRRMFQGFLDRDLPEVERIVEALQVPRDDLEAVRLVSHHTRLLGVLVRKPAEDWVILVDLDPSKRA